MKSQLSRCLLAAASVVALILAAGETARADLIGFTYTTTASPATLTGGSLSTTSLATLTETPTASGLGVATSGIPLLIPIATYTVTSNAIGTDHDFFNGTITQLVTIQDTASGATGIFTLSEFYFGGVNQANTSITPSITVLPSWDSLLIGNHLYSIDFMMETYNNRTQQGSIQIGLAVTTAVPEPSALTLAGIGVLGFLAYARCRRPSHSR